MGGMGGMGGWGRVYQLANYGATKHTQRRQRGGARLVARCRGAQVLWIYFEI